MGARGGPQQRLQRLSDQVLRSKETQPVIAVFNVAMIGHVNPTFPLVAELARRGCRVHYFLPPGEEIRAAARASGAIVEAYVEDDAPDFALEQCGVEDAPAGATQSDRALWERAVWPLASVLATGEYVVARCKAIGVQAVLYDPMTPHGLVVAEVLGVPCLSVVTFPGMGSIAGLMSNEKAVHRARDFRRPYGQRIRKRFGVDVQERLLSRRQYFCRDNLVTTSEDLIVPLPPPGLAAWADECRERFRFHPVGCLVGDSAAHVTGAPSAKRRGDAARCVDRGCDLPTEELDAAVARGAKVVFAAFGSMAMSSRWRKDLGRQSGGNLPTGTTGKAFCQHVWLRLLTVMQRLGDSFHCVLCVGTQPDALDFLGPETMRAIPGNVTLRSTIPQTEMLRRYADVFVSHMGFNSMQESLRAGVPFVAVPQAMDQPANAMKAEAAGWGRAFVQPMDTLTAEALESAVREVASERSPCRKAVAECRSRLHGGERRAADWLMALAAGGGAQESLPRRAAPGGEARGGRHRVVMLSKH